MSGFYVAQEGHVVNILPPINIDTLNATTSCVVFSMENYSHASIIIQLGVTGAASTVTVEECNAFTPTSHPDIAFNYYACTTAASDVLGAMKTVVAATGFDTSANDSIFYVIELDAAQLSEGYPYVRVNLTDPAAATIASAVAILSGARYASDQSPTAIA